MKAMGSSGPSHHGLCRGEPDGPRRAGDGGQGATGQVQEAGGGRHREDEEGGQQVHEGPLLKLVTYYKQ